MFGILSLVACQVFGIAAWVMANTDLHEMACGRMDPSGRDMTQAGRICGIIGTVLLVIPIVVVTIMGLVIALSSI